MTAMRPRGVDNAPYFAAFVASSWSTSAIYCCSGPQLDHWPGNVDPPAERRQLLAHQRRQLGAFPAAAGEQAVDAAKRLDAASHRLDEAWQTVRPRQLPDRLDYAEQVHGAVVDLAPQQLLALRGALAFGDIAGNADEPQDRKRTRLNSSH